jgi:hypothetical protein
MRIHRPVVSARGRSDLIAPLAAVPDRTFAEIGAMSDLIERRVGAHDALESRGGKVDIHPTRS